VIRSATIDDGAGLTDLWRSAGLRLHPDLVERELASVLARDLVLVDEEAGELTEAVLGSYDGLRGRVRRLATRADHRGRGVASGLLAELERRLLAAGCPKVNLFIEPGNAAAAGLYARRRYRPDQVLFMEKWLVGTFRSLGPERPGYSRSGARPRLRAVAYIQPELSAEPYVFGTGEAPPGVTPFAVSREDEGVPAILTRADADRAGLAHDHLFVGGDQGPGRLPCSARYESPPRPR
jgi:GNAT superfamily N-acetyltransferase